MRQMFILVLALVGPVVCVFGFTERHEVKGTTPPNLSHPIFNSVKATVVIEPVWIRDTSHPKLGEAWRDPSGMIWGDMVTDEKGKARTMNHQAAKKYCESIGATLPSREDFIRLREYMGAKSGSIEGYLPQVLPNLTYEEGGKTFGQWFWSSSIHPEYFDTVADFFDGRDGVVISGHRVSAVHNSARCVVAH